MGNLLGEPFKDYVTNQINDRQAVHGKANRTIEEIQYLNSRNAWIKLASGTSFTQDRLDLLKKNNNPLLIGVVPGQDLAIRNVLFNGLSSFGKSQLVATQTNSFGAAAVGVNGNTENIDTAKFSQTQRAGITGTNRAYGVGGTSQHGYSPMPGIMDADIKDLNRGSIKKATINIKAHNRNQFDVIDALYLRLGYSVMLEWGVDKYLDGLKGGNGDVESMGTTLIDRKFWKYSKSSYNEILPEIEELRKKYKGNYDGFFGVISNFSWTFEADGTYNIKLELMSQGDIIESLKANLPSTNLSNENQYEQIKNQNLESTEDVTQDKFYNNLYPGLKELLTNWFNGNNFGFGIKEIGLGNSFNTSPLPWEPTTRDDFDFPKLNFGAYDNQGIDNQRKRLIQSGAFDADDGLIFDTKVDTIPEKATLYALQESWRNWVKSIIGGRKVVTGGAVKSFKYKPPNYKNGNVKELDYTFDQSGIGRQFRFLLYDQVVGGATTEAKANPSETRKQGQRRFIMNNISLDDFLFYFYEYFKNQNLAGGSEDIITNLGKEKTEEETSLQEQLNAEVSANEILERDKNKNKVYTYLYDIQKYEGPSNPTPITVFNQNIGTIINPTNNKADEWNSSVKFPIYKPALAPLISSINQIDIVRLNIQPVQNQYFIRLGTFLEFFEKNVIPKIKKGSNKDQPMILIDYDIRTNICYTIDNVISLNPNKTIINNSNFFTTNSTQNIYPELNSFIYSVGEFSYGNIMNIYFSFNRIREIMDEVDTNNQISVFKVLKSLTTDINESLGNINNIEPIIDKESNTVKFIDQTSIPGLKTIAKNLPGYEIFEKPEATLEIFGLNPKDDTSNFVRSAGITTEISKEYATIITIGATANGAIPGAESTAFSKWNIGIEDRFKENIVDSGANGKQRLEEQNQKVLEDYINFLNTTFEKLGFTDKNGYTISSDYISANKSSAPNYYTYAQSKTLNTTPEYTESSIGFLPFNLKLSMDGLSGIKIYNKIKVNTAFLPSNYGETLSFIVTGVNHKLSNNEWVTSLDTIATTKEKQDTSPNTVDTEELLEDGKQPQPQSQPKLTTSSRQFSE